MGCVRQRKGLALVMPQLSGQVFLQFGVVHLNRQASRALRGHLMAASEQFGVESFLTRMNVLSELGTGGHL